jgi:hypothetical protein
MASGKFGLFRAVQMCEDRGIDLGGDEERAGEVDAHAP